MPAIGSSWQPLAQFDRSSSLASLSGGLSGMLDCFTEAHMRKLNFDSVDVRHKFRQSVQLRFRFRWSCGTNETRSEVNPLDKGIVDTSASVCISCPRLDQ